MLRSPCAAQAVAPVLSVLPRDTSGPPASPACVRFANWLRRSVCGGGHDRQRLHPHVVARHVAELHAAALATLATLHGRTGVSDDARSEGTDLVVQALRGIHETVASGTALDDGADGAVAVTYDRLAAAVLDVVVASTTAGTAGRGASASQSSVAHGTAAATDGHNHTRVPAQVCEMLLRVVASTAARSSSLSSKVHMLSCEDGGSVTLCAAVAKAAVLVAHSSTPDAGHATTVPALGPVPCGCRAIMDIVASSVKHAPRAGDAMVALVRCCCGAEKAGRLRLHGAACALFQQLCARVARSVPELVGGGMLSPGAPGDGAKSTEALAAARDVWRSVVLPLAVAPMRLCFVRPHLPACARRPSCHQDVAQCPSDGFARQWCPQWAEWLTAAAADGVQATRAGVDRYSATCLRVVRASPGLTPVPGGLCLQSIMRRLRQCLRHVAIAA